MNKEQAQQLVKKLGFKQVTDIEKFISDLS